MDEKKVNENKETEEKTSVKKKPKKEKKSKNKDYYDKQLEEVQKELDELVENMKVVAGEEVPKLKISDFTKKKLTRRDLGLTLIEIVLSIVLLVALTGYIQWLDYRALYFVFIMFGGIILIEVFLNFIIKRFFLKLVIYSLGAIKFLPTLIAFVLGCIFAPGITILSIGKTILVFVLYLIIKSVAMFFIEGKSIRIIRR